MSGEVMMLFSSKLFKQLGFVFGVVGIVSGLAFGYYLSSGKNGTFQMGITSVLFLSGTGCFLIVYCLLMPTEIEISDRFRAVSGLLHGKREITWEWSQIAGLELGTFGTLVVKDVEGKYFKILKELSLDISSLPPGLVQAFEDFDSKPQLKVLNFIKVVLCYKISSSLLLDSEGEMALFHKLPKIL